MNILIGRCIATKLVMGRPKGGKAAAIIYTLAKTCKKNKVDTNHYLANVLERLKKLHK